MRWAALLLAVLALSACNRPVAPKTDVSTRTEQVQFKAADGVEVFGTWSQPANPRAIILLFHQAGSGQGEYLTIAPRLNAEGFATLTIDARAGGGLFGGNWTVKKLGHEGSYLEARQDLEAALAWASTKKLPVILWGSSYSASLVFLIAAEHPEVKALLAFSPGEYFDGKPAVGPAASRVAAPVFVTSAQDQGEIAAAKALIDVVPAANKRQFAPVKGGVHGSSILIREKNPGGAEDAWSAVLAFLDGVVPRP
ncbi:lysophospholipase [Sphingomonas sp. LB-2]|uniref:alpha/beta hydrolase n=1 Tax=Sphingomonas caeni TaxID=2984949 RepID=UPI002232190C|nr:lysophospholipase [Sphingomonas caeni]MCW3845740.1 lysophospholipase [Sphingomonas caeni]